MLRYLFLILISTASLTLFAQPKMAIVNLMDSSLFHVNVGVTVFSNTMGEFSCGLNTKQHVNQNLLRLLSTKFTVEFISPEVKPVVEEDDEVYASYLPEKMNYKDWVKEHGSEYTYVIFVENKTWTDPSLNIPLSSNGLLTSKSAISDWAKVYSTVYFTGYHCPSSKKLRHDKSTWFYTRTIEDYKFMEENTLIAAEMLPVIHNKLVQLMDDRTEHFLIGTNLLSRLEVDNLRNAVKK